MAILNYKITKAFKMMINLFILAKGLDQINMAMVYKFGQMERVMKVNGL